MKKQPTWEDFAEFLDGWEREGILATTGSYEISRYTGKVMPVYELTPFGRAMLPWKGLPFRGNK